MDREATARLGAILSRIGANARGVLEFARRRVVAVAALRDMTETARQRADAIRETLCEMDANADAAQGRVGRMIDAQTEVDGLVDEMAGDVHGMRGDADAFGAAFRQVSGHVKAMAQIARMARLLAVNASIEAARAGEAGRGFAVVAREMGELADRSGRRAAEIGVEIRTLGERLSGMMDRLGEGEARVEALAAASTRLGGVLGDSRAGAARTRKGVSDGIAAIDAEMAAIDRLLRAVEEIEGVDQGTVDRADANVGLTEEGLELTGVPDGAARAPPQEGLSRAG